ncbi:porin [Rhodoferax sp.]|uniref:porin n=1 Tax=Rhodoferax sp. TaxID=50421 RepID=UPI00374DBC7C
MKKHHAVSASMCLALALSAHAEPFLMKQLSKYPEYSLGDDSKISLYGSMDMGLNVTKAGDAPSMVKAQSGGSYTSKLGMYGREDLGGGLRAEFNLESGFQADTGASSSSSQLFDRASWVGLRSREWGAVRLGNQLGVSLPLFADPYGVVQTNSMSYWLASAIVQKSAYTPGLTTASPIGLNSDLGNGATQLTTRVPRSISYTSPRMQGVEVKMLYAPGAATTSYNRVYTRGGVANMVHGPWYTAVSYSQVYGVDTSTLSAVRTDVAGAAAIYDTGSIVLSAAVNRSALRTTTGGSATVYSLGAIYPVDRHELRFSVVYRDTSGVRNTSTHLEVASSALGLMAGYDYAFSKSVGLYGRLGVLRNSGASTVVLNNASLPLESGTSNAQLGVTSRTASVGMYYHF